MSDTQRPKSAGDKLAADEINRDLPVTMTGGETIDTSSTPQAVYLKAADGKVYQCDANAGYEETYNFVGFLVEDTSDGNDAIVQTHGVVSGFSGLTAGSIYYLSNTAGVISTTPGTYKKQVGLAISTTELLIQTVEHWEYIGTASANSITSSGSISNVPTQCRFVVAVIETTDAANDSAKFIEIVLDRYGKTTGKQEFNQTVNYGLSLTFDSANNQIDYTYQSSRTYNLTVYYYT